MDEKQRSGPIETPADFEDAFRAHFAPVYRFIARRVGTGLAEDLAAEAFATAYRRRAAHDPARGSVRSWLFGIAANVLRGHWRDEQDLLELDARLASGDARSFDNDADSRGNGRTDAADRGGAGGTQPGAARRAAAARVGGPQPRGDRRYRTASRSRRHCRARQRRTARRAGCISDTSPCISAPA